MGVTNPPTSPPPHPAPTIPPRSNPTVRAIARQWRRLTRQGRTTRDARRRTLIALSAGPDSLALTLALAAAARPHIALAHVVHDLRPRREALDDRDRAAAIARDLDLPFLDRTITTDPADNPERAARDRRYDALADMAREAHCPFVATAHHADDQLESIVMALIRGSGPDGLRGIAESRPIHHHTNPNAPTPILIRPALHIPRAQLAHLTDASTLEPARDASNLDTSRLRAALRHGPLADITALRPGAATAAARAADLLRDAAGLVHDRAAEVFANQSSWPRDVLRSERPIVVAAGLRAAALRLTGGSHADDLTRALLDPAVEAIRDDSTDPRTFHWPAGLTLTVTAHTVSLSPTASP